MNEELHKTFDQFFTEYLNDQQQDIVKRVQGTIVIHAGAGSGKTRIITARIASLILKHGIQPHALIALTFTNKAAREMKERVTHFLGTMAQLPFVGTFHSYCLRLLRIYDDFLEVPRFTILDDDDQDKLLKSIIDRFALSKRITPKNVSSLISRIKNNSITGTIPYETIQDPILRDIFHLYEREKAASHTLDFDDLLITTLKLFKTNPSIKQKHQELIKHILVDEYQDTNRVQHALIKEMSLSRQSDFILDSLCVVGDEDQSIYSWRGAIAGTMVSFKEDFSHADSLTLEQNYRSVKSILDVANELIKHNTQRKPKNLWSTKQGSDRVRLVLCASGYQEGEVTAEVAKAHQTNGSSLSTLAVLYRSHYQSRAIEEALVKHSIPYVIVGGIQFYNRQEIKDLLAYLKLIVNPFDRIAWSRIINVPARGLGDKFQELFLTSWDQQPSASFKDVALHILNQEPITKTKNEGLQSFITIFNGLDQNTPPLEALEHIIASTRYTTYIRDSYEPAEAIERQENIKELIAAVRSRQEQDVTTIAQFLEEAALLQEKKNTVESDRGFVHLMTLHAAKGLEFKTVFIAGVEEGILPSGHSLINTDSIEEERRLLYVGITRAQERLLISLAHQRSTYGHRTIQRPSRFIKELATGIQPADLSPWSGPQIRTYCRQWFNAASHSLPSSGQAPSSTPQSNWYIDQKVTHPLFGSGTIEHIEYGHEPYLTIRFAQGLKKIAASFVK